MGVNQLRAGGAHLALKAAERAGQDGASRSKTDSSRPSRQLKDNPGQQLEQLGASHCIPGRSNRHKQRRLNKKLYRQRYKVENYFCRLKRWASASTRRDKLAAHFLALIQFASVIDWLRYGC